MTGIDFRQSKAYEIMAPDLAGLIGSKYEVQQHVQEFPLWIESIPLDKLDFTYGVDKWTIRGLLGHIIDSHIIILYRLLAFARGDKNPLPGADEILWARFSGHEKVEKEDLVQGYRKAASISEWMVNWLPEEAMERKGTANGITLTVRELHAYLIAHERHHRRIAKERYEI